MGVNDPGNLAVSPSCIILPTDLYSGSQTPTTSPGFLTPGYVEPTDLLPSAWSVRIYYTPTLYKQFTWFIKPETMKGTATLGQRGPFEFVIDDSVRYASTGLPFQPVEGLYVVVQNYQETYVYAAGYIAKCPKKTVSGYARDDGTEQGEYHVQCTDLFQELEWKTVDRQFINVRIGRIVKDAIDIFTNLDASDIDPFSGIDIALKRFKTETPAQVIQWAADIMNWTYIIDPATRKVKILAKDNTGIIIPQQITDDNVYDYFDVDTFELGRDADTLKNQIEFWYNEKFFLGAVNTAAPADPLANVIVANGANTTDWTSIPSGTDFYVQSSTALYSVEKNLTANPPKELRLSSAFKEGALVGVAGWIKGWRKHLFVTNEQSVSYVQSIRGGDGVVKFVLTEDSNNFTTEEARIFAAAQLALSSPLAYGRAQTSNDVFNFLPLREGMVIDFDLVKRKGFKGKIAIQSLAWSDMGGEIEPDESFDGAYHPHLALDLEFTPVLTGETAQARKTSQDLRRVYINDLAETQESYSRLNENIIVKDCIHVRKPAHTGLYNTGSAYTTDLNHYSFTST